MNMNRILKFLGKIPKPVMSILGVLLAVMIGVLDRITGYEISFTPFYLLPVLLITWFEGGVSAAVISVFSAVIWLAADVTSGHVYSHFAIPLWNATMRLGIFLTVAYSFATIKKLLEREREQARVDYLTNVPNARYFYEQTRVEISRSARYKRPFTIAYIDIDNFKSVNDTLGHGSGDELLQTVAETMKTTLRLTDIIARLGGDEFAVFLPETGAEQATVAINKVQKRLRDAVEKNGWPVTFSLGVVSCYDHRSPLDELIKIADHCMYTAKKSGKNTVKYKRVDAPPTAP
jgi:diguanylate cyclase (GGDEF)-like protein